MKQSPTVTQISRQIARRQRLRQEAVDAVQSARRARQKGEQFDALERIARDFKVTRQTLHAWVRASDATGGAPPPPRRPGRPPRWGGARAVIVGDLHRHLLAVPPEHRTTEALIDWFSARTGVQYAPKSVPRMLWRLGCSFVASEPIEGAWSGKEAFAVSAEPSPAAEPAASPTSVPDWLTEGRRRRILDLVRGGVDPRHSGPLTVAVVMQQLPTMAKEMQAVGAAAADLCSLLPLIGVRVDPISGRLRIV